MDVGEIVRRLHWRAWDPDAPAPEVSIGEVVAALPVLIESGSAGVVWPRLRDVIGADHPAGMALEAAAASQAAHNARAERELARVVGRLREAGVEPVLIKGLAVARIYPAGLVRPAGDLDLVVRDEDYTAAIEALAGWRLSFHRDVAAKRAYDADRDREIVPLGDVDLHSASKWYGSRDNARFFAEAQMAVLGDAGDAVEVRVPRVEDHLRALCLHFLRHGAVRPVRLCDIALLVERYGADLAWDRMLTGSRSQVEQVGVAIRLAEELLDARVADAPILPLPAWIGSAVNQQWAENKTPNGNPQGVAKRMGHIRKPAVDPITLRIRTAGVYSDIPMLLLRLWYYAEKILGLPMRPLLAKRSMSFCHIRSWT